jgi:hypothetical protein
MIRFYRHSLAIGSIIVLASPLLRAQSTIAAWNFDNLANGLTTSSPAPSTGLGTSSSVGMTSTGVLNYPTPNATGPDTSNIDNVQGTDTDNSSTNNNVWRIVGTNGWNSGTAIGTQGAQFNTSTAGETNISVSFDIEITVQGEANLQVEYTTNGTLWQNAALTFTGAGATILTNSSNSNIVNGSYFHGAPTVNDTWFNGITANLTGITAVNADPNFGIRIVNAATGAADVNLKTNGALNNTSGNWRLDDVTISGTAAIPEPSTWALVIGVLALGFAAIRRRTAVRA